MANKNEKNYPFWFFLITGLLLEWCELYMAGAYVLIVGLVCLIALVLNKNTEIEFADDE